MKILISGATGFIGRRLLKALTSDGHSLSVLSRHAGANMPAGVRIFVWDPAKGEPPMESLNGAEAVIHLAGEPIGQRWSEEVKRRIRDSRAIGTRNLVAGMTKAAQRPAALICASAIGYYGSRGDEVLTESSAPGTGFLPDVCSAWEKEAQAAEAHGVRVVSVRTGVVLDARGGALPRMLPPFKLGVGGKLAGGNQWMSWIHVEDLVGIYKLALEKPIHGPVNGVAPEPVTNAVFTRTLGGTLKRPAIIPVPAFGLKLLFGEMSEVLLGSQRVKPNQAEAAGYRFRFPQLGPALQELLR